MIVAIEGPSAAGKTTWCRSHFPDCHIAETPANIVAPDLFADPAEVGQFWVNHAIVNWRKALDIERKHDLAVCDGDPFHLYFSWSLWKSGAQGRELFDIESVLYQVAFDRQEIGFVDHVLWIDVPQAELRRRAHADTRRRRKRQEIYLALVPWMKTWFATRELAMPGTLRTLRDDIRVQELKPAPGSCRYDTSVIERMLAHIATATES